MGGGGGGGGETSPFRNPPPPPPAQVRTSIRLLKQVTPVAAERVCMEVKIQLLLQCAEFCVTFGGSFQISFSDSIQTHIEIHVPSLLQGCHKAVTRLSQNWTSGGCCLKCCCWSLTYTVKNGVYSIPFKNYTQGVNL